MLTNVALAIRLRIDSTRSRDDLHPKRLTDRGCYTPYPCVNPFQILASPRTCHVPARHALLVNGWLRKRAVLIAAIIVRWRAVDRADRARAAIVGRMYGPPMRTSRAHRREFAEEVEIFIHVRSFAVQTAMHYRAIHRLSLGSHPCLLPQS